MSRVADPAVRTALIETAARLLAAEGSAALSTRRLAAEVGASTMTIYTHFGSMSDLHAAVRREGFTRLAVALDSSADIDDPVTNLAAGALAYLQTAMDEPELYWAMFNHRPPPGDDAGTGVFDLLRRRVSCCADGGRFHDADPARSAAWAGEVWAALHGMAVLAVSGAIAHAPARLMTADILFRLSVGFGDEPMTARRSIDAAVSPRRARTESGHRHPAGSG